MRCSRTWTGAIGGLLVLGACSSDHLAPPVVVKIPPQLTYAAIAANPDMTIAAKIAVLCSGDSVRLRYRVAGTVADSVTPGVSVRADTNRLPLLGLLPSADYVIRAVVFRDGDSVVSDSLGFTTGALPADVPTYSGSASTAPGLFAFSAGVFGLVIDRTGRVVWYHRFPGGGPGLNFTPQARGVYVGRLQTPDPNDDDPMVEISREGAEGRQMRCAGGRPLRFHDILVQPDSSYWLMCDDFRTMDLTALGGQAAASVQATVLQHVSASGALLFEWDALDHFLITDLDSALYVGAAVNFTHGNAFDFDTDGNVIISFRSLNEITKINVLTGAVMWRMGGKRNQFTFTGSPNPGFTGQHSLRVVGPNRFILLDNAGSSESRYERYLWNAGTMTAALEQSYGSVPGVITFIGGSVQQSGPNRYVVSFGTTGRVEEFDETGATLWKINGNPGYVFRFERIESLYRPVPVQTR